MSTFHIHSTHTDGIMEEMAIWQLVKTAILSVELDVEYGSVHK